MSNFVFNNAKGKVAYYAGLPGSNDALVAVPLQSVDLEPDENMIEHSNLAEVLAVSDEQTTIGRKTLTGVTVTVDAGSDANVVDSADFTYTAASGAAVGAFVICYVPDVGVSSDSSILLLTKHDFSVIPSGADIPVQISSNGLFVAS